MQIVQIPRRFECVVQQKLISRTDSRMLRAVDVLSFLCFSNNINKQRL